MSSNVSGIQKVLWWFAAADPQILSNMRSRSRMAMSALGLVFMFNFMVLIFIWSKVGLSFFGFLGILAPGILVPSTMLLLDRVVSLGVIKKHHALKKYSESTNTHGRGYLVWRICVALCFSFATSFVFMLDLSDSLIKEQLNRDARVQNEELRDKYASRINESIEVDLTKLSERKEVLKERLVFLQTKYQDADNQAQQALEQASEARAEAASEKAGLGSRVGGEGPRYKANMRIYDERTEFAKNQQEKAEEAKREMDRAELELTQVNERLSDLDRERQKELSSIDAQLEGDLRYVPIADGFFAKSSAFMELFKDEERGSGILATTIMLFIVLFLLEMAGFIAVLMMPVVPYYIALTADNEQEIARIVAESDANIQKYKEGKIDDDPKLIAPTNHAPTKTEIDSANKGAKVVEEKPSKVVTQAILNQPNKKGDKEAKNDKETKDDKETKLLNESNSKNSENKKNVEANSLKSESKKDPDKPSATPKEKEEPKKSDSKDKMVSSGGAEKNKKDAENQKTQSQDNVEKKQVPQDEVKRTVKPDEKSVKSEKKSTTDVKKENKESAVTPTETKQKGDVSPPQEKKKDDSESNLKADSSDRPKSTFVQNNTMNRPSRTKTPVERFSRLFKGEPAKGGATKTRDKDSA